MKNAIPVENLIDRRVYRLRSRNLIIGAWDRSTNSFIGIRKKFGSRYLFAEYEHSTDDHLGTAQAMDDLGVDVPTDVEMRENLDVECSEHNVPCSWSPGEPGGAVGSWSHEDGTPLERSDSPESPLNQPLFDLLVQHERRAVTLADAEVMKFLYEFDKKESS